MQVPFDFSEVEPKPIDQFLPVGKFECQVKKVEMGHSKEKKTPFIKLTWQCLEPGIYEGKIAVEYKYLTSGTAPYIKGWSEEVMNVYLNAPYLDEQLYLGRYADVEIKNKEHTYQESNSSRKEVISKISEKYYSKNVKSYSSTHQKKHQKSLI